MYDVFKFSFIYLYQFVQLNIEFFKFNPMLFISTNIDGTYKCIMNYKYSFTPISTPLKPKSHLHYAHVSCCLYLKLSLNISLIYTMSKIDLLNLWILMFYLYIYSIIVLIYKVIFQFYRWFLEWCRNHNVVNSTFYYLLIHLNYIRKSVCIIIKKDWMHID